MILAYCNQKGGVGKSTTVYHHARAAILDGQRVLVIDADPQGNITSVLTEDMQEGDVGVADALSSRSSDTLADVLVPGIWEGLTVAPTVGDNLADVRNELVISSEPGRESRLRAQLAAIQTEYDLVLIDCGPAIDPLTISALTAADAVVIVWHWSVVGPGGSTPQRSVTACAVVPHAAVACADAVMRSRFPSLSGTARTIDAHSGSVA